jgi:hypothetical protein
MLLMGLLVAMASSAETIYKWVDDTGQVHYSDVPRQGAVEVVIAPVQTFSSPSATQRSLPATAGEDAQTANYDFVEISSPAAEETIWNTGGLVTVAVSLQPGLQMGHQIVLFMDDRQVAVLPQMSSSVQLQDVERGARKLRAEVIDENGTQLISSTSTTFYYQQTSVTRRPNVPKAPPKVPPKRPAQVR